MAKTPTTSTKKSDNSTNTRARTAAARAVNPALATRRKRKETRDTLEEMTPWALEIVRRSLEDVKKAEAASPEKPTPRPTDTQISAARDVLNRVLPPLRPVAKPVTFRLSRGADVVQMITEITVACSKGKIQIADAKDLISSLTKAYTVIEMDSLRREMDELKRALEKD